MEKEVMTFRLDPESKKQLKEIARNESRNVSQLIDFAVKEFIRRRLGDNQPSTTNETERVVDVGCVRINIQVVTKQ